MTRAEMREVGVHIAAEACRACAEAEGYAGPWNSVWDVDLALVVEAGLDDFFRSREKPDKQRRARP